jgi:hypothetical protein
MFNVLRGSDLVLFCWRVPSENSSSYVEHFNGIWMEFFKGKCLRHLYELNHSLSAYFDRDFRSTVSKLVKDVVERKKGSILGGCKDYIHKSLSNFSIEKGLRPPNPPKCTQRPVMLEILKRPITSNTSISCLNRQMINNFRNTFFLTQQILSFFPHIQHK